MQTPRDAEIVGRKESSSGGPLVYWTRIGGIHTDSAKALRMCCDIDRDKWQLADKSQSKGCHVTCHNLAARTLV